jgi:hypothetical protein
MINKGYVTNTNDLGLRNKHEIEKCHIHKITYDPKNVKMELMRVFNLHEFGYEL